MLSRLDAESMRSLVGTHASLMQLPPYICADLSTRASLRSSAARRPAIVLPALPHPMTRTSAVDSLFVYTRLVTGGSSKRRRCFVSWFSRALGLLKLDSCLGEA